MSNGFVLKFDLCQRKMRAMHMQNCKIIVDAYSGLDCNSMLFILNLYDK